MPFVNLCMITYYLQDHHEINKGVLGLDVLCNYSEPAVTLLNNIAVGMEIYSFIVKTPRKI